MRNVRIEQPVADEVPVQQLVHADGGGKAAHGGSKTSIRARGWPALE
jgi:hypothetical protein